MLRRDSTHSFLAWIGVGLLIGMCLGSAITQESQKHHEQNQTVLPEQHAVEVYIPAREGRPEVSETLIVFDDEPPHKDRPVCKVRFSPKNGPVESFRCQPPRRRRS